MLRTHENIGVVMEILTSKNGKNFKFNPDESCLWEIFDNESGRKIGSIEVDDNNMFTGANIDSEYQRLGVATKVVQILVNKYELNFYF